MHPFPPTQDLQFLVSDDNRLQVLAIGPYQLTLSFDNGCVINVENSVTYVDANGVQTNYAAEWRNEKPVIFHRLLERRLIEVKSSDWLLELKFEGGEALWVHSDSSMYEAGQVSHPNGPLIVF